MPGGESIAAESQDRREKYLEALRQTGDMRTAAAAVDVNHRHPYSWAKSDPSFAHEFQMIRDRHHVDRLVEALEAAA